MFRKFASTLIFLLVASCRSVPGRLRRQQYHHRRLPLLAHSLANQLLQLTKCQLRDPSGNTLGENLQALKKRRPPVRSSHCARRVRSRR